ncbi:hypothetical protein JB92DRAFT_3038144 [Gautieria morchelliformis]|nr:hypothetical protein JB92DRAFT_3038144 [Gautieria morchelliformis]
MSDVSLMSTSSHCSKGNNRFTSWRSFHPALSIASPNFSSLHRPSNAPRRISAAVPPNRPCHLSHCSPFHSVKTAVLRASTNKPKRTTAKPHPQHKPQASNIELVVDSSLTP